MPARPERGSWAVVIHGTADVGLVVQGASARGGHIMNVRKLGRRWFSGLLVLILMGAFASEARAQAEHVRWDIVIVAPPTVSSGGTASAQAQDGSTITMTGSGTFVAPGGGSGSNGSTTGGGMWTTCTGAVCATGM